MRVFSGRAAKQAVERLASRGSQLDALEPRVRQIVNDVRLRGDASLRKYAERWDGLAQRQALRISSPELIQASTSLPPELKRSLRQAARNIRQFCERQKPKPWRQTRNGISLGQLVRPLESVGCYVPGGRHPLVSTLLMTVIPAQVARVNRIVVVSPQPSPEVLGAAGLLGVGEFYRVGGAQAIAALAYGTETVSRVDKIVGPGNAYVTAAKKLVAFDCAIDFLAGPTEAVVLGDVGNANYIAADLVAQAEHDDAAVAVFITTSRKLAQAVVASATRLSHSNPTARRSLARHGKILIAASRVQARQWANLIAPEHLTVAKEELPYIQNAGSVFVGNYSPQSAGDYVSGPNHVLPTAGQARFRGGLGVLDFVKIITVQDLSSSGLRRIAPAIECLAETEGLLAHAESIRVRCARA
jgi:histidinol dehydrogenase